MKKDIIIDLAFIIFICLMAYFMFGCTVDIEYERKKCQEDSTSADCYVDSDSAFLYYDETIRGDTIRTNGYYDVNAPYCPLRLVSIYGIKE